MSVPPLPVKVKFDPAQGVVNPERKADQFFRDYMLKLDLLVGAMAQGFLPPLVSAANDAAAAAAGVQVGQIYVNGSVVMQRQV